MILPLDVFSDFFNPILAAFVAFILIATVIAAILGYVLYRLVASLTDAQRNMLFALMIFGGLVLIVTGVGAEPGVVLVLAPVFTGLFTLLMGGGGKEIERSGH